MTPATVGEKSRRIRNLCLSVIALLYVGSVPWYREAGEAPGMWLGLPDWVAVSVLCYVAVAILNAVAWLSTEIPDQIVEPPAGIEPSPPLASPHSHSRGDS